MSSLKQRRTARRVRDPLAGDRADLAAKRELLERGIEQLLALLDKLDGNPDDEPAEEDEGAQCDDEGMGDPTLNADSEENGDDEPDHVDHACHWQDEGDQSTLVPHAVYAHRRNAQEAVQ